MKNYRILFSLLLIGCMLISLCACGENEGSSGETAGAASDESVSYSVTVQTKGGMAMENLDVYVFADDSLSDLKQFGKTDAEGKVSFQMPESNAYAIQISGAPKGYQVAKSYGFSGSSAFISLESSLVTDEAIAGASLGLGDVMYDFSVMTPAGETVTLSEVLQEKKMVLLNFWYTTCTYCVAEFPYMQEAYETYLDDVGIIAVNPLEQDAAISAFQSQHGLTFSMAKCAPAWASAFGVKGYPTSVIIDRYGVICLIEEGGITSLRPFVCLFDAFTADDYEQKLYSSISELVTRVTPTYEMESSEEVAAVVNQGQIEVNYYPEEKDEYSWPFVISEKLGDACLKASNQQIDSSYSILYADVTLKAGQAVGFDYLISSEYGNDILHVIVDDQPIYSISGVSETEQWERCYPWVAQTDGTYKVALCYIKDDSTSEGDDTVYIRNMRAVDASEVDVETYIPRMAAVTEDEFTYTYPEIVLSDKDGYYHVGTADGPLLLADLMNVTQFNEEETVWSMVDNDKIVVDGYNYYDELVEYCSLASNSNLTGVVPVNEELAQLLKIVADVAGFDEDENEWLKICKYFQAYGSKGAQLENPILGLSTFCPLKATMGKNVASNFFYYDHPLLPRGKMAEFIPAISGVYRITTRVQSQKGIEGWIFDENLQEVYLYEGAERMYNDPDNISMVLYMEAGKPYYIDICFWDMYETGYIYYDIEYVAPTYKLFRACAPGYFTYDSDATGDSMYYLITLGIDIVLGKDGVYYEDLGLDAYGNQKLGSPIYVDFVGATGVFSTPVSTVPAYNEDGTVAKDADGNTKMITGMIDLGGFDFSKSENDMYILSFLNKYDGDVEATDEYLRKLWGADYDAYAEIYQLDDVYEGKYHGDGEDLTEEIKTYLDDIINTPGADHEGCVIVTERLAQILQMLMDKYTFENVEESWQKMCYYYESLGPKS